MVHAAKQGAMLVQRGQRAIIRDSLQMIEKFTGRMPKGWLGPGLTETWETLDLLAEAGIEYVSDWVNDAQPYAIRTAHGPLVSVPYTLELNDIPTMVIQHHQSSAWVQRCTDQFERLYAEGATNPRVMAIAVHPYIHGVPHRIAYFEAVYDYMRGKKGVWLTTGEEIYEWWKGERGEALASRRSSHSAPPWMTSATPAAAVKASASPARSSSAASTKKKPTKQ